MAAPSSSSSAASSFSARGSLRRSHTLTKEGELRKVCKYGTKCNRRNPQHMADEAHPADADYLDCCRASCVEPEFISVYQLFKYCDHDGSGKARREEMSAIWPKVQALSSFLGPLDDDNWALMDDDGNGYVNFSEFADFATRFHVDLPLGLDALLGDSCSKDGTLCCGVKGCSCNNFAERRPRCKYGAECYRKNEDHKRDFCHPTDADWEANSSFRDPNMCWCGHKRKLHSSASRGASIVPYPSYWASVVRGDSEFNELVPVGAEMLPRLQRLVDLTYSDVTTRDRVRHSGSWMVPRHYVVTSALRNENSRMWRKYTIKKTDLEVERQERERLAVQNPQAAAQLPPYSIVNDVLTTHAWLASDADGLESSINEWYLWHGTSQTAAITICHTDFKMRLAGTNTATLYGKGTYLAESITKADEYAKQEDGSFTVLLCRVLGGLVRYCDEREPDANALTKACVEGDYDCVVGDRRRISGTYREFVIFDAENVYPEYLLTYKRGEVFKSPSHP